MMMPDDNDLQRDQCDDSDNNEEEDTSQRNEPTWTIFILRALTSFGDRIWAFGIGIFMNFLASENLRLVAIYGFSTSISVIVFGPSLGQFIDRSNRITSGKLFLIIQNVFSALSGSILFVFFRMDGQKTWNKTLVFLFPWSVIFLSVISNLASVGSKISVEKDWVVVLAGNDKNMLAKMNSWFRTIDLFCLLVAPLLAGVVFEQLGKEGASAFICIWNIVSMIFEQSLIMRIYTRFPSLGEEKKEVYKSNDGKNPATKILSYVVQNIGFNLMSWKVYMQHSTRYAGLGLALLYMTVLNFDNITYGYCMDMCVTEMILGCLVGLAAIFGVTGSVLYPQMRKHIGLEKTGLLGFIWILICLLLCVVSIWLQGSPFLLFKTPEIFHEALNETVTLPSSTLTNSECHVESYLSVGFFLAGVTSARLGLWILDLAINQIQQEQVELAYSGLINGVQSSFNSVMTTIKYTLVILLPEPATFGWLVICSYGFVISGAILFLLFVLFNSKIQRPIFMQRRNVVYTVDSA